MDIKNYSDPILKEILEKIIPEFYPTQIYLFGSRAKENFHLTSDYDLFFVVPQSDLTKTERAQRATELTWRLGHSVDYFIYTESEFYKWKNEINSIAYTALTEGLELQIV